MHPEAEKLRSCEAAFRQTHRLLGLGRWGQPCPQWGRGHAQQMEHSTIPLATAERIIESGTQVGGGPLPLLYLILERARGGGIFLFNF